MTTALGPVTVDRAYAWHREGGGAYPADGTLGIDGFLTRQATRLVALVGVEQSFARAQRLLAELCGWTVDDETIRQTTHAEAKRVRAARPTLGVPAAFAAAPVEVQIDAGKVNTRDGWRDVKLGLLLGREPGAPATPEQWCDRVLPAPAARAVVAAVEDCGAFGDRLRAEADRLGVTAAPDATVLGDGAEWVWNLAGLHLPQAAGVLDVFHAAEHVADAAKAVWGEGGAAATRIDAGRRALLAGGRPGLDQWIAAAFADVPEGVCPAPLVALAAYFAKHPTRLDYAGRLAAGRSIGSGAVEGAIKQTLNLRLKRTGARWRAEHVGPLVELRALSDTPEWDTLWVSA